MYNFFAGREGIVGVAGDTSVGELQYAILEACDHEDPALVRAISIPELELILGGFVTTNFV